MLNLPLIDGALFIDNSSIEILQSCSKAFEYNRFYRRISKAEKPSLNFGSAVHLALEYRYKNCLNNRPTLGHEEAMVKILEEFFDAHHTDEDEQLNFNLACEIIKRYNIEKGLEPFNILVDEKGTPLVELSFAFKLFDYVLKDGKVIPIFFSGKIDLPVSWHGKILIGDHKTSKMYFGMQNFLEEQKMSYQPLGYCYAFEKLTNMKVDGYFINAIRTRTPPAKPREKTIEDWWKEQFGRDEVYLSLRPNWREEWLRDFKSMVERVFMYAEKGYFPMDGMFTRACARYGGCQYRDVCMLGEEKDRVLMVQDGFVYTDNLWSPLKEPSQGKQ